MPDGEQIETERPPVLLCLYALSQAEGWQSVREIREEIETETGERPAYSTLADTLVELRVAGRVDHHKIVRHGSETVLYRLREPDPAGD